MIKKRSKYLFLGPYVQRIFLLSNHTPRISFKVFQGLYIKINLLEFLAVYCKELLLIETGYH